MNIFQNCDCIYCKEYNDFPVLWELKPSILWFEIPKNGSFSLKKTYKNRTLITSMDAYKDQKPYVVLRDPIDRFFSLFKHYFLRQGGRFRRGKAFCERLGQDINTLDVDARLEFLITNLNQLATPDEVHHFYPQTYFIDQDHFSEFNLIDIKSLTETLNVPVENHTRVSIDIKLTTDQQQYIEQLYKDDYVFLHNHNFKFNKEHAK